MDSLSADFTMEIYGSQRTVTAALEPAGNEIAFTVQPPPLLPSSLSVLLWHQGRKGRGN